MNVPGGDGQRIEPARRISRAGIIGASGGLLLAAVAAVLLGTGFRDNDVALRASGAWLEHTGVGLAVHAHGATGLIDAKVQVVDSAEDADPILGVLAGQFRIEQEAELVYLVSEDGCEVLRFDEARLNLAKIPSNGEVRRVVEGDDCSGGKVHADETTTYLVDHTTGHVEPTDPRSLEVLPDGAVEVGERLASSNVVAGRFAAITEADGALVVIDEGEVQRSGLLPEGRGASVVVVGDDLVAVGPDGDDTVVALPDGGLPARLVTVPGLRDVQVAPDQLSGVLWMSGTADRGEVMVGVDLGDGSLTGPVPAPSGIESLGAPLVVGERIIVPVDGPRVATIDLEEGGIEDTWPEEPAPEPFTLLVSAGRVWANSPSGDLALRCDALGCTESLKNDPSVETVRVTNPREPDPPKAVTAADREVDVTTPSSSTTTTTVASEPAPPVEPVTVTAPPPPPDQTRIATPPGPVRNLEGRSGDGSAHLTWLPPVSGDAVDYLVESESLPATAEVGATFLDVGGLANGRPHTFQVRARNASGVSTPMQVSVTPTESLVGNAQIGHVDEQGGKLRVDWQWPDGIDSAQLVCRSTTNDSIRFGSRTVNRGETPLVVDGAPRNHDVVCDVTTRATAHTNVLRAVARPRIATHQLTATGPGQAQLSFTTDLGGAAAGSVTFTAAGATSTHPANASNIPVSLPAGNVGYTLVASSVTDASWSSSPAAEGSVSIAPRPVTGVTGTSTGCCEMTITWTPPPMVAGSTAGYQVDVVQPVTPTATGCGFVETNSCVLVWNEADVTGPLEVSVSVEAMVNSQPAEIVNAGPFTLPAPAAADPDTLRSTSGAPSLLFAAPLLIAVPVAGRSRLRRQRFQTHHNHEDP